MQRELEITVLSATNLKRRHGFSKTRPSYAVVWIDSHSKAPTHIANHDPTGKNISWNSVTRMLCRESLFGTAAKAKLIIEIFDQVKVVANADVLLSELKSNLVWGSSTAESSWSEPKRVTLDIRKLRTGSYQREKVIGSVDIQVRVGREAANRIADREMGTVINYKGLPIQLEGDEFVPRDFQSFEEKSPAPSVIRKAETEGGEVSVYYQHACVEKPKAVWRGISDPPVKGMGVLAMGVFI